jgi:uncharacterized OsmC-like protein
MADLSTVVVNHRKGNLFEVAVRQHALHTDQPLESGGDDIAPTPTELFVASLASCVAFYARRFLERHDLPYEGLSVLTEWQMGARPSRVSELKMTIKAPAGVPESTQQALLAVASHCTVHNTLRNPPEVTIELG